MGTQNKKVPKRRRKSFSIPDFFDETECLLKKLIHF